MSAAIEAARVCKTYGQGPTRVEAVRALDLVVRAHELTVLVGPSGSGKTTLLSILGCMLTPTSGTVRVCGVPTGDARPEALAAIRRRHIGFVFQSYHLFSTLTAAENVQLALDIRSERGPGATAKSAAVLADVGLSAKLNAFPRELSGGEQQRVAIARAVITRPDILVADEPTGNVDPDMAVKLLRLFEALNRMGTTIIVATHDVHLMTRIKRAQMMRLEGGRLSDPTGALRYPPRPSDLTGWADMPGKPGETR